MTARKGALKHFVDWEDKSRARYNDAVQAAGLLNHGGTPMDTDSIAAKKRKRRKGSTASSL